MIRALFVLDRFAFDLAYGEELRHAIAEHATVLAPPQTKESVQAMPEVLCETEVLFSGWGAPRLDDEFLAAAPQLRAVFYAAGSVKHLLTPAFWARDIAISTAAAANAIPVADYTLAAILFSLKHGWRYALEAKRCGRFPPSGPVPGSYRTKIGLISLGHTGRLVRERLRPFEVDVLAFDPQVDAV
ncbi:MAG TPA: glycerate dehydrogenase, partial [Candidatus Synoicihabitans sp.]|nr:glycerate dehydrogenase [Candidatus Synoicihabitans sp.]